MNSDRKTTPAVPLGCISEFLEPVMGGRARKLSFEQMLDRAMSTAQREPPLDPTAVFRVTARTRWPIANTTSCSVVVVGLPERRQEILMDTVRQVAREAGLETATVVEIAHRLHGGSPA
jgi:hypothetical protein